MGQFSFKMGIELAGPYAVSKTTITFHKGATLNISIIVIKSMPYTLLCWPPNVMSKVVSSPYKFYKYVL